jgi:hypothetical protein
LSDDEVKGERLVNSAPMINRCFRHQHPEAYGEAEVPEPPIPMELRYGQDRAPESSAESLPEERGGYLDAVPLTG